jgi:hypothetical protein
MQAILHHPVAVVPPGAGYEPLLAQLPGDDLDR